MLLASSNGEVEDAPHAGYAASHVASDSKPRLVSTVRSARLLLTELHLTVEARGRLRQSPRAALRKGAPEMFMLDKHVRRSADLQ